MAVEIHLACGDTVSSESEPRIGAYRMCTHCDSRKRVVAVSDPTATKRVTQIECCGIWVDYPTPGSNTQCPACHSVFSTGATTDMQAAAETVSLASFPVMLVSLTNVERTSLYALLAKEWAAVYKLWGFVIDHGASTWEDMRDYCDELTDLMCDITAADNLAR
jgi:hypothetical protein